MKPDWRTRCEEIRQYWLKVPMEEKPSVLVTTANAHINELVREVENMHIAVTRARHCKHCDRKI